MTKTHTRQWTLLAVLACPLAALAGPSCNGTGFQLDSTGHALPLVLSFHGADDTPEIQQRLSQFSEPNLTISGLPVLAAYPAGSPNAAANRTAVWYGAPYSNKSVDDVQFTKDIIADVSSAYCVNASMLFASGKSNGGGFTNYLACRNDTSAIFAAFAPVSPALYNETLAFSGCAPSRPIPLITSHGLVDQTIPFAGRNDSRSGQYGVGTSTANVTAWREQWALRNGCTSTSANVSQPYATTTEYVWSCNATLQAYTVANLGHSWPTTLGLDPSGAPNNTASFNLTAPAMADFFGNNSLPEVLDRSF